MPLKSLIKIDFFEAKVVYDHIINKVHYKTSFLPPFSLAFYPSTETVSLYTAWNINQSFYVEGKPSALLKLPSVG